MSPVSASTLCSFSIIPSVMYRIQCILLSAKLKVQLGPRMQQFVIPALKVRFPTILQVVLHVRTKLIYPLFFYALKIFIVIGVEEEKWLTFGAAASSCCVLS
jgi:cellulose synthase/poly-beta-1,6-N-acetylglucosamine synthase-like glycosyltransferase